MTDWLRCLDCGWTWDDLNSAHEICDCFSRLGRRRSQEIRAWPTYGLDGQVNGATNTPPSGPYREAVA